MRRLVYSLVAAQTPGERGGREGGRGRERGEGGREGGREREGGRGGGREGRERERELSE